MKFAVSSLSFVGPAITRMDKLPPEIGIEIFYEWGSPDYWEESLRLIMNNRAGRFSIHSPFVYTDISLSHDDETRMFEVLRRPFDLYQRHNGEFYVVHTNGPIEHPQDIRKEQDMRKRVIDRLFRFEEICAREGIQMVVENLGFDRKKRILFNQQEFLAIFEQIPHLKCLIDTGHAVLADFNICEVQDRLKDRIIAYHVHDNNGEKDEHLRIDAGRINWEKFAEGFSKFTPNATMVFEYNSAEVSDYLEDMERLKSMIK